MGAREIKYLSTLPFHWRPPLTPLNWKLSCIASLSSKRPLSLKAMAPRGPVSLSGNGTFSDVAAGAFGGCCWPAAAAQKSGDGASPRAGLLLLPLASSASTLDLVDEFAHVYAVTAVVSTDHRT